ncbi:MAG: ELM1/GtrOC1 family putative glycosyltransferase [Pseudomonadota bacterium]
MTASIPHVWALLGHRAGDNAQVRALAQALGGRAEAVTLDWRRPLPLWSPLYGRRRSLAPLTAEARARIGPPWPDLILSIGWRSVPVARWIAGQGGAAHIHLGRPRAPLEAFDLVLTTAQYGLPDAPNVVRLPGPLGGPDPEVIAAAGETWRDRFAHLHRPWIAILAGGPAPPLRFGPAEGRALGRQANALAQEAGGSLLLATSPRTPAATAEALLDPIDRPAHVFRWGWDAANPYHAYLALADAFVVTGDSVSMMHEAVRTGRPVHILPLPSRPALPPLPDTLPGVTTLRRAGILRSPRRAGAFVDALIADGRAVRLDDPAPPPPTAPPPDPMDVAVRAVADLMRARR